MVLQVSSTSFPSYYEIYQQWLVFTYVRYGGSDDILSKSTLASVPDILSLKWRLDFQPNGVQIQVNFWLEVRKRTNANSRYLNMTLPTQNWMAVAIIIHSGHQNEVLYSVEYNLHISHPSWGNLSWFYGPMLRKLLLDCDIQPLNQRWYCGRYPVITWSSIM